MSKNKMCGICSNDVRVNREHVAKLQAELEELKRFEKLAMETSTCPQCGTGIVSYCMGCKIKQLQAENQRLWKALDMIAYGEHIEDGMRYSTATLREVKQFAEQVIKESEGEK